MPENGNIGSQPESANGEQVTLKSSEEFSGKVSWVRRIPPEVYVFLLYGLVAVFLTWPVTRHMTRAVYGIPSDNLGTMWGWWWQRNASALGGSTTFSPLIGFPFGQHFPALPLEFILEYGARFMLLFTTQTVVLNLLTTSSFALSGITMYYLVRHLTHDRRAAFFGGFAFLVGAYHALHSMMFADLAQTQWMPLFILMLLWFIKKPSTRNGAFLCASWILLAGTSIHYGFFMVVFAVAFLLGRFAYKRLWARYQFKSGTFGARAPLTINKKTLVKSLMVVFVGMLIVSPFIIGGLSVTAVQGKWPTRLPAGGTRSLETSAGGSAHPLAYVLPEKDSFFLGWITRDLAPNSVGYYENSLYLGLTVIALAAYALAMLFIHRRRRKAPSSKGTGESVEIEAVPDTPGEPYPVASDEDRAVIWGIVCAVVVAFILSMPPFIKVGSVKIWLPSIALRYLTPWLRWYMRFGIVVIICMILLACFGISWLTRRMTRTLATIVILCLTVFLFIEMTLIPPLRYYDVGGPLPKVFQSVASMEVQGGIVIYPAFDVGFFNSQRYLNYQQTFKKPMLNGASYNSDGEALRRTVYNPFNPLTPGILKRFGIERVVYLGKMFEQYEGTEKEQKEMGFLPPGLELEKRVVDKDIFGDGSIFKVTAPPADLVPIYQGDITTPIIDNGRVTVRLMESKGIIRIVNYTGRDVRASVQIPVSNLTFDHDVSVRGDGTVYWHGRLNDDEAKLITVKELLVPAQGLDLTLSVRGPEQTLNADEASIFGTSQASLTIGDVLIDQL